MGRRGPTRAFGPARTQPDLDGPTPVAALAREIASSILPSSKHVVYFGCKGYSEASQDCKQAFFRYSFLLGGAADRSRQWGVSCLPLFLRGGRWPDLSGLSTPSGRSLSRAEHSQQPVALYNGVQVFPSPHAGPTTRATLVRRTAILNAIWLTILATMLAHAPRAGVVKPGSPRISFADFVRIEKLSPRAALAHWIGVDRRGNSLPNFRDPLPGHWAYDMQERNIRNVWRTPRGETTPDQGSHASR